jgi:hypothetical protein
MNGLCVDLRLLHTTVVSQPRAGRTVPITAGQSSRIILLLVCVWVPLLPMSSLHARGLLRTVCDVADGGDRLVFALFTQECFLFLCAKGGVVG